MNTNINPNRGLDNSNAILASMILEANNEGTPNGNANNARKTNQVVAFNGNNALGARIRNAAGNLAIINANAFPFHTLRTSNDQAMSGGNNLVRKGANMCPINALIDQENIVIAIRTSAC